MSKPLVSCIMPTANRQKFIPFAINYFLSQDYDNKELIIVDDGKYPIFSLLPEKSNIIYYYIDPLTPIGAKRNYACEKSSGEIIIHWDDDDWYASGWITATVEALSNSGADICGLNYIKYYISATNEYWSYRDKDPSSSWIYGATFAYWKSHWKKNPFQTMQLGEDIDFISREGTKVFAHENTDKYLGIIHSSNISMKPFDNPRDKNRMLKWMIPYHKPEEKKDESLFSPIETSHQPLVSCIMPTANRKEFIPNAISNFINQNYSNKELIIIDDGIDSISELVPSLKNIKYFRTDPLGTLGKKRNFACNVSVGSIIVHWDDDDWYAADWITHQVIILINSGADICGLNQVIFHDLKKDSFKMTKNFNLKKPWLSGATLAYWKSFWEKNHFQNVQIKEDDQFVRSKDAKIYAHDYYEGFVASLHPKNTTIKQFEDPKEKRKDNFS